MNDSMRKSALICVLLAASVACVAAESEADADSDAVEVMSSAYRVSPPVAARTNAELWADANEVKRKEWPVYKEITRKDREERASRELELELAEAEAEAERSRQQSHKKKKGRRKKKRGAKRRKGRLRTFQRQNDKFIGKEHTSDIVERSGEVGQGRSAFQLKEEKGPDGATHGGYGYVDKEGDLHLVEYKKDREGRILESNQETIKNYVILKNPKGGEVEKRSSSGEGASREMLSSESFLQPLYVDRSHMVEKAKSARNAEPGPLSLSAAVPLLGYAAELFGLTSPQKRQVSAASAPLPDDHELPPYGPPYNDDTVIASQAEKKGLSQEPWIPVTSGEQALLPPPPPPVFRNVPVASKDDWQKLKNQRPPLPLQGQTPEPEAIVGALIRDSVGPPLPAPPPPIIKKEKTNWKARQNAQLDAINNAIEDAEISSVVGAFEPQKLTQDPVFAKFAAENSREKTQHKRQPDNTGRNQFSNFPPRNIARPAPTPPPKHDIPLPPIPTHPPGADKPVSFQQFAVNGVEINFDNVHDKEAAANEKNKPVKDQRRGQKKRKFPNRVRLRRPQNGDNKPAARPVPDSLAAILEDEANKEEVQRPGRTLANLLTTLAPTRRPAPPIPTRAPLPHPAIHLPTQVPAPLPHLVEESHGLPPRIPPPLPIEPNPGHHFPAVEIGTAAPLDGPAHVAVPQPHVPLVPPHVNVGHPHRPGLHHNLEPITKAPLAHIQETTAHPSEVSTLPPRIIPPAYGHPTPPSYHHPTPSPYGHHRSTPTPSPYGHHLSTPTPAAHVHSTPTPHVPHFITTTHPPPSAYHHSTPTPHPPPPSPYPTTAIYTPKPLYGEKILEPFDLVDEVHHKAHFDHAHPHHPASRDESDDSPYRYKVVAVEGRQLPIRPFRHGFGYTTTPVPPYAPYHPHSLYTTTPPPAYSHNDLAPFGHSTPVVPYGAVAHTTEPPGYDGANKLSHPIQVTLKPRGDLGLKHPGIGGVPDPFFEGSSPVASYAVPPSGPAVPAASKPVAATAAPNFKHVSTLPPRIFPSPTFGPQNRESRAVGAAGGPTLKPFPAVPERTTKSYPYGKAAQEGASMLQPRIPAAGPTLRAKRRIDAGHRAISASRRRTSSSSSSRRRKLTPKEIREQVRKLPVRG